MFGAPGGATTLNHPDFGIATELVARRYQGGAGLLGSEQAVVMEVVDRFPRELALEALQAYGFQLTDGPNGPEMSDHSPLLIAARDED